MASLVHGGARRTPRAAAAILVLALSGLCGPAWATRYTEAQAYAKAKRCTAKAHAKGLQGEAYRRFHVKCFRTLGE